MIKTSLSKVYAPIIDELLLQFKEYVQNGQYIGGRYSTEFETKVAWYLGATACVGCKSGTHSLVLALKAAGVGPGDEVISVGNTYYATIWAIKEVGAKPVFCDISLNDSLIDVNQIEPLITSRTKAILPVHLYGIPCDLDRLKTICEKYQLQLIEDASHAFGSKYHNQYIGSDSDYACFSLYPTKNLGAFGDSGVVVTNNEDNAEKVRSLVYFSKDPLNGSFNEYAIHAQMDSLQAALLSVVLNHFEQYAIRRKQIAKIYADCLKNHIPYLRQLIRDDVVPYVFCIFVDDRDGLASYLKTKGIFAQVHYRNDLHRFKQFAPSPIPLPNTEWHNQHVLSLHVSPDLRDDEIYYICETLLNYYK
jgi:dTDP-4-amino-4,6-dideoxygalactose transaminase